MASAKKQTSRGRKQDRARGAWRPRLRGSLRGEENRQIQSRCEESRQEGR
jgi:hypothetical protein